MNRQGCHIAKLGVLAWAALASVAPGQDQTAPPFGAHPSSTAIEVKPISLPTGTVEEETVLWSDPRIDFSRPQSLPPIDPLPQGLVDEPAKPDFRKLMRPRFNFGVEWEPETSGLAIGSYDGRVTVPTYPLFGPPPMISAGFSFTDLHAPASFDLPSNLYDVSLGISGVRKLNERWMLRWMISSAFASDWENTTRDAWQFRGGVFALWQCTDEWQITLGAMATGRNDLPVLPAAGAIWQPSSRVRVDLMMPRPRVNFMVADRGSRQHWIYAGGGIDGGTWAYQRSGGLDELLTYREWRLVLGWEAKPPGRFGGPPAPGLKLGAEIGYVIGRTFEFDSAAPDLNPDNALLLRATVKF